MCYESECRPRFDKMCRLIPSAVVSNKMRYLHHGKGVPLAAAKEGVAQADPEWFRQQKPNNFKPPPCLTGSTR